MKFKKALLFVVLCLVCVLFCACNGASNITSAHNNAIKSISSLECIASVTDSGVVVYKYSKKIYVEDTTVSIITTESTLNSSFVLEDKTTSSSANLDRTVFKTVNLAGKYVSKTTTDGNTTTCIVSQDHVDDLLGASVNATSDATVTAEIVDNVLQTITVEFSTSNGRVVTINYAYNY